jgi:class 3 adenylate cyclase
MSFRLKLLLAMMLVVGAITGATLLATQRKVQNAYEEIFEEQFRNQIGYFAQLQELRLANTRERSLQFAKSPRVQSAMEAYLSAQRALKKEDNSENREEAEVTAKILIQNINALIFPRIQEGIRPELPPAFASIVDETGAVIRTDGSETPPRPGPRRGPSRSRRDLDVQLSDLSLALKGAAQQQTGYLAPHTGTNSELHEVILTKILDAGDGHLLGALVLGFRISDFAERSLSEMSQIQSGIFLEDEIHSTRIPEKFHPILAEKIKAVLGGTKTNENRFSISLENRPFTVFFRSLNLASDFPAAYQVCLYSLEQPARVQSELRTQILTFGALALLAALIVSLLLSHSLAAPINQLVAGTHEVEKGNFDVRVPIQTSDELGRLARSFNHMTEGLALKEKYRGILDIVADPQVAADMINQGKVALGGEEREVSVLFCDIRGFTALTQNMPPEEVVQMLNEHFTPLTQIVYDNGGVVDKFVGDLIMAFFGAPTGTNDPKKAVQCAMRMIEERAKQNENSKYKITVGIGVASGKALAGRMGSKARANYTVLGARVNLASRLCGQAARQELVIDEPTYSACKEIISAERLPELKLKGFSDSIQAYKVTALKPQ